MTEFYKLYQNEIYTVNSLLPGKSFLQSFNCINRCFNYNYVCSRKRTFDSDIFEYKDSSEEKGMSSFFTAKGMSSFFTANWQDFEKYIDKYFENDKDIKGLFERLSNSKLLDKRDKVDIHYNLLKIFNSYPVNPRKYIDGILRTVAKKCAKYQDIKNEVKFESGGNGVVDVRFKYVEVNLLTESQFEEFPWVELTFYDTGDKGISFKTKTESAEKNGWSHKIIVSQDQENPAFYKEYPSTSLSAI